MHGSLPPAPTPHVCNARSINHQNTCPPPRTHTHAHAQTLDIGHLRVVASVLGQSVALAQVDREVRSHRNPSPSLDVYTHPACMGHHIRSSPVAQSSLVLPPIATLRQQHLTPLDSNTYYRQMNAALSALHAAMADAHAAPAATSHTGTLIQTFRTDRWTPRSARCTLRWPTRP